MSSASEFLWSHFRGLFVGNTRLVSPISCYPGQTLVRGLRTYKIKTVILCKGEAVIEVEGKKAFTVEKDQKVEVQCESS